jgi:hypothetical protein
MQSPADAAAAHQAPKAGPVTVAVEKRSLTANVVAQGSVEFASPQSLALAGPVGSADSGAAGAGGGDAVAQRITKAPLAGTQLKEGDVLMQVSGRPVLVLKGSVPMYRTLGPGTSGDDVKQLKQALSRLGFYPGGTTDTYGSGAASAVTRWYKSKGFPAEEPTVADKQQLGVLEQAVLSAQQQLLAAKEPGGSAGGDSKDPDSKDPDSKGSDGGAGAGGGDQGGASGKLQLRAAQQQLDTANAALSAFQAGYGTKVPAGEVVFLPDLPARLDKVTVKTGDTPSGPIGTVTSSKVVVQAVVPGTDAKLLHKDMTARIETPDGKHVTGTVAALGEDAASTQSGSGDDTKAGDQSTTAGDGGAGASAPVPLRISLSSTGQLSRNAGGAVVVTIKVNSSDGAVLVVPVAAIRTSADGAARVQVMRGKKAVNVSVEVGLSADGLVEFTPAGGAVRAGDHVVVGR